MLGHESASKKCFSYDLEKGLWNCFHCQSAGDVFDFIQAHENVDFVKAKNILAAKVRFERTFNECHNRWTLYKVL